REVSTVLMAAWRARKWSPILRRERRARLSYCSAAQLTRRGRKLFCFRVEFRPFAGTRGNSGHRSGPSSENEEADPGRGPVSKDFMENRMNNPFQRVAMIAAGTIAALAAWTALAQSGAQTVQTTVSEQKGANGAAAASQERVNKMDDDTQNM